MKTNKTNTQNITFGSKLICKITIFIVFLTYINLLCTQPTVWIHDDGNPDNNTDPSIRWKAEYWRVVHNNPNPPYRDILSPFFSYHPSNLNAIAFGVNSDFYEIDGWELLSVYLGNSNVAENELFSPYVILYNKNRGVIRYFYKYKDSNATFTSAFARLRVESRTGILSTINTGDSYIYALDKRTGIPTTSSSYKYEESYSTHWMYADFYVAYDDDISLLQHSGNQLHFSSRAQTVGIPNLTIDGIISQHHSTGNNSAIETALSFGNNTYEYVRDGVRFRDYINEMPDRLASRGVLLPVRDKINDGIYWLSDYGITGMVPYINTVAGVIGFFSGNSSGISAVQYSIHANISGTFTTNYSIADISIYQPGAISINTANPEYNEPLGLIGLKTSPSIQTRQVYAPNAPTNGFHNSYRIISLPDKDSC